MAHSALDKRSITIRREILNIIDKARRGHIGSAFSIAEILRVLYDEIMRFKPRRPLWEGRDRFILSKGHGCLALYVILAEKGFFLKKELSKFCAFDGILGGHPQEGKVPGVEWSTGSLGHGLPVGVGMAIVLRRLSLRSPRLPTPKSSYLVARSTSLPPRGESTGRGSLREKKRNPRVFVLMGDGECNEGSIWEAAMTASKYKLDNLFVLVDYNKMMTYGPIEFIQNVEPFSEKWKSFGFDTQETDGHDIKSIRKAIDKAISVKGKPHAIICHTVKGKGIPSIENIASWHHKAKFSDEEIHSLLDELGFHR